MTREQAINSMISHGFTVEQTGKIIKAVTPQFSSGLDKNSKKLEKGTTKNDCEHCSKTYGTLGCCDFVSNEPVYSCKEGHEEYARGIRKLGSTTKNNLGVEEVTALAEWTKKLTKASEDAYNKGYADGMKEPRWIPVSERLPEIHNYTERYLVTLERGWVRTARFTEYDGKGWWTYDDVVAWMPLPKPYREVET